jgi:hypothetical protein
MKHTVVFAAVTGMSSLAIAQNGPTMMPPDAPRPEPGGAIQTERIRPPHQWPAGFIGRPVDQQAHIFKPLTTATGAALAKNGFNDLTERLTEPDRKRVNENRYAQQDFPELDKLAAELREKFRQKYGVEFNVDDPARVFDIRVQVAQGEVIDPNLARDRFPLPAMESTTEARMASGRIEPANVPGEAEKKTEEHYLTTGRKVAIVSLPTSPADLSAITVSLSHESLDNWKIDIPDNITGKQLHDNLFRELTKLNEMSAHWPSNVNEAKRAFVRQVVIALYDLKDEPKMDDVMKDQIDRPKVSQPQETNPNRP